jgi:oligoendopeptidase F
LFTSLPNTAQDILDWSWDQLTPYFDQLVDEPLTTANLEGWMLRWSQLANLVVEMYSRMYVATSVDTTDKNAEQRFTKFLDEVYPAYLAAEQKLKEILLASGLEPPDFDIPLRNMRTEAAIFRQANLPLRSELEKFNNEYDKIVGAQTIQWQGEEKTLAQLRPIYESADRETRAAVYHLAAERQLQDRPLLDSLWQKMLALRLQVTENAGYSSYTEYRWKELLRYDYTPQDCARFRAAIQKVVVPAAARRYEIRRQRLGIPTLRPWDLYIDPFNRPPLRPYQDAASLKMTSLTIFQQVDPQLGNYFDVMDREGLLDLDNRKGKAPGGYCIDFSLVKRPFIFMNGVGLQDDVQTILHEGGHAFHVFETAHLPYHQQVNAPMEFAEVASMAMELLAAPFLPRESGGFYTQADAARARIEHLESNLLFWPYMAVVDGFQHWVYANPAQSSKPDACDQMWAELWEQFMPGVDYSGLEDHLQTGWHRKIHIFQVPFYYVEYGIAQLGAAQVWANARRDQTAAVAAYRRALAFGGTAPLPELYQAAGAKFAFDEGTLRFAVDLIETTIEQLEAI